MQGFGLLLIDEASMIGLEMQSFIEMYAGIRCIVIFVGDDKQLNPVGEEDSPVFIGKPTLYDKLEQISDETVKPLSMRN
jgi:ATP-dependent exoDNAse (exonuclease V) alpha subunit